MGMVVDMIKVFDYSKYNSSEICDIIKEAREGLYSVDNGYKSIDTTGSFESLVNNNAGWLKDCDIALVKLTVGLNRIWYKKRSEL
jgi:hypothetical protein